MEAWPYEEARRILEHPRDPGAPIILETGFGPSGLPHIGTFGEVVRTSFIMLALRDLGACDVRCYVFSDDMDGLRKVPVHMPESLAEHLGKPLHDVPDPFGCCHSYAGHMNGLLVSMVERMTRGYRRLHRPDLDIEAGARRVADERAREQPDLQEIDLAPYHFLSSTRQYRSGTFNAALRRMLERVEAIRGVILPTLGEGKREDWSPFFPVCASCDRLYTTRVTGYHPDRGSLDYVCDRPMGPVGGCGHAQETTVDDGRVKVGWKVDWALRWYVLGITYEMYGKDLIESASLSKKIVRLLEGRPPVDFFYEMFLDEDGSKISKSVGRGVTVETWLGYAPFESLALFMYRNPRRAKRLFLGVIPQYVDEMLKEAEAFYGRDPSERTGTVYRFLDPVAPPDSPYPAGLTYGTVVNMVGTIGTRDPVVIHSYLRRAHELPRAGTTRLDELIEKASVLYDEVVFPTREEYVPTPADRPMILDVASYLETEHPAEAIQSEIFAIARRHGMEPKTAFRALYGILTGQERGPRLGSFIKILGESSVRETLMASLTDRPEGTGAPAPAP